MDDGLRVQSHEIVVPRTSRYAVLGASVSDAREIWLVCHGYGQLAERFISKFSVIDDGKRMIVAPEGLSRFYLSSSSGGYSASDKVGASWMTREGRDAEIADQATYIDLVRERVLSGGSSTAPRVVGLGFSQGAATMCRWAARTASPPEHVVLWGAGVPAELLEGDGKAGLTRATLTIVVGANDSIAHGGRVEIHRKQLDAASIKYRFVAYDGGHEIDGAALADIAAGFGVT